MHALACASKSLADAQQITQATGPACLNRIVLLGFNCLSLSKRAALPSARARLRQGFAGRRTEFSFSSSAIRRRCASFSFCSVSARTLRSVIRHFWRSRKRRCAALHAPRTAQDSKRTGWMIAWRFTKSWAQRAQAQHQLTTERSRELTQSIPHRFFSLAHFATPPLLHACGAGFSDELPCDASSLCSAGLRTQA